MSDQSATDFEAVLAESGQALNDDGCLVPANTKGDGRPCECPCHEAVVLPDGCVDGHSPDLVNCELGVDWP